MGSVSYVLAAAVLAALVSGGACIPSVPPGPNITTNYNNQWLPAKATWRRMRDQGREPGPLQRHDRLRQRPHLQGRQGMRLLLRDQVPEAVAVLRQARHHLHHRQELRAHRAVPHRPLRQGLRRHGPAREGADAPLLRGAGAAVQEGALQVRARHQDHLPRREGLQPQLPGRARQVRLGRRRRRADGHPAEQVARVDSADLVVGRHLEVGRRHAAQGPLLHPRHQRVRQEAHRQGRHPRQLEGRHRLPVKYPVLEPLRLNASDPFSTVRILLFRLSFLAI
uniref:Uncharacterized protein n=1 Tax=Triticum urartu TaxID=4572 RepID=A0A8R7K0G0_TRIUA